MATKPQQGDVEMTDGGRRPVSRVGCRSDSRNFDEEPRLDRRERRGRGHRSRSPAPRTSRSRSHEYRRTSRRGRRGRSRSISTLRSVTPPRRQTRSAPNRDVSRTEQSRPTGGSSHGVRGAAPKSRPQKPIKSDGSVTRQVPNPPYSHPSGLSAKKRAALRFFHGQVFTKSSGAATSGVQATKGKGKSSAFVKKFGFRGWCPSLFSELGL